MKDKLAIENPNLFQKSSINKVKKLFNLMIFFEVIMITMKLIQIAGK